MAAPLLVPPVAVRLKNVLYATDFSEGSTHALPYVQAVAKAFGCLYLPHSGPYASGCRSCFSSAL